MMKKIIISALVILVLAAASYGVYFKIATARTEALTGADGQRTGLVWLRQEFALGDEAFERLQEANAKYAPHCEANCAQLAEARRQLAALVEPGIAKAAEIEAAYAEVSAIEQRCFRMTLHHIDEVSRLMTAENGARYRRRMIGVLLGYKDRHFRLHSDIAHAGAAHEHTR